MHIHLATDYKYYSVFHPVYTFSGQLMGVELLTHIPHNAANIAEFNNIMLPQPEKEQHIALFCDQVNRAEAHQDFFRRHHIHVIINVDALLAQAILDTDPLMQKIASLDRVVLEISESFPGLARGNENPLLNALSERFLLSLKNYGSGNTSSKAIYDNIFWQIKLDSDFIQHNVRRLSFQPFITSVLRNIKPYCRQILVQSTPEAATIEILHHLDFDGIQSPLFTHVREEQLDTLLQPPALLSSLQRDKNLN